MIKVSSLALTATFYGLHAALAAAAAATGSNDAPSRRLRRRLPTLPGCYPTYNGGASYTIGDPVSATVQELSPITTESCTGTANGCENGSRKVGGTPTSLKYNFECSSPSWCGHPGYGPGEQYEYLAWTKKEKCEGTADLADYIPEEWTEEGCPSAYVANDDYDAGAIVSVDKGSFKMVYECQAKPSNLFCGMSGYEPGTGQYWSNAWTELGSCSGTLSPTESPNFDSLEDLGGCPDEWEERPSDDPYQEGDRIQVNGIVFQCKPWPKSGHCSQDGYVPFDGDASTADAWKDAWQAVGSCQGSMGPTESPIFDILDEVGDGCPEEYSASNAPNYRYGDQVAVTVSDDPDRKVLYECKPWPLGDHCVNSAENMRPGQEYGNMGWILKGHCLGTISPTPSPTQYIGICTYIKKTVDNNCNPNQPAANSNPGSTACSCTKDSPPSTHCTQTTVTYPNVNNWSNGVTYANGDVVRVGLDRYKCKVEGWCNQKAYEPVVTDIWKEAWTKDGQCDVNRELQVVTGNEIVLSFEELRRMSSVEKINSDVTRRLDGDCLTLEDLSSFERILGQHALSVYESILPGYVYEVDIEVTDHVDISIAGDCSSIKFIYNQEMLLSTSGGDDSLAMAEIIELPLATEERREAFANSLVQEASSLFTQVNVVGEVVVTQEGIAPTNSPTVSERPSSMPSENPSVSGQPSSTPSEQPSVSGRPSSMPSENPSLSDWPSSQPSESPSISGKPSSIPSEQPSDSGQPSSMPSKNPSVSGQPSSTPSEQPSVSGRPSSMPSENPTVSDWPSSQPSESPSISGKPSLMPSEQPSVSGRPSLTPSDWPSSQPSESPSISGEPSLMPSEQPSVSGRPSLTPSETNGPTMTPTKAPTNAPTNRPTNRPTPPLTSFTVNVNTDDYPAETSWTLYNLCTSSTQLSVGQSTIYTSQRRSYTNTYTIPRARYTFTLNDSYGDGLCCSYGYGSYSVVYDGGQVGSGATFGSYRSHTFGTCA